MFENLLGGNESNPFDILKKLLEPENIELKTQLSISQIKVLVTSYWFKLIKDPKNEEIEPYALFMETMDYYLLLMTSKDRAGRKEIIDGLTKINPTWLEERNILKPEVKS